MANVLIIKELICKYFASCVHLIIPLILTFRFLFLDIRKRNLQLYEKFYGGLPMLVIWINNDYFMRNKSAHFF